jgi:hypothetical protein
VIQITRRVEAELFSADERYEHDDH